MPKGRGPTERLVGGYKSEKIHQPRKARPLPFGRGRRLQILLNNVGQGLGPAVELHKPSGGSKPPPYKVFMLFNSATDSRGRQSLRGKFN